MDLKIDNDIKQHTFSRVYLLYGEERYLVVQKKLALLKALVPEGDEMNFASYEEKQASTDTLIDFAETMPFLSEYRVILLTDTGLFHKEAPKELISYMEHIPETAVLIFVENKVDKRSAMYKAVKKFGTPVEYGREPEPVLMQWVAALLKAEGKSADTAVIADFLNRVGQDMARIKNETEKLISYTGTRKTVTKEDLNTITSGVLSDNIFAMVDAFSNKNERKAFSLYYELLRQHTSPFYVLHMLTRQFNILLQIHELSSQHLNQSEIAQRTGIHPYGVKKNLSLARSFSEKDLRAALISGVEAEEAFKAGRMDERTAVELFMAKNCR